MGQFHGNAEAARIISIHGVTTGLPFLWLALLSACSGLHTTPMLVLLVMAGLSTARVFFNAPPKHSTELRHCPCRSQIPKGLGSGVSSRVRVRVRGWGRTDLGQCAESEIDITQDLHRAVRRSMLHIEQAFCHVVLRWPYARATIEGALFSSKTVSEWPVSSTQNRPNKKTSFSLCI